MPIERQIERSTNLSISNHMVWNAERRNSDYLKKVQQHRNRSHKNMKKSPDKNFWAVTSQKF